MNFQKKLLKKIEEKNNFPHVPELLAEFTDELSSKILSNIFCLIIVFVHSIKYLQALDPHVNEKKINLDMNISNQLDKTFCVVMRQSIVK